VRSRLRLALVLVLVLAGFAGAPASAASAVPSSAGQSGGIGIGLVEIPSAAQNDPRARRYIVDNLPPGTSISRRVQVTNSTAEAQEVRLYSGSASIVDGAFSGGASGSTNELAQWTRISPAELQLGPGAEEVVLVTVDVPQDAPEGEQYAAVWAEISSRTTEQTITTASRAGIRMYVSVAPGNGPAADFALDALTASRTQDGRAIVTVDVRNSGGRALDLTGELRLMEGPSGLSAGPFSTEEVTTLAPGKSGQLVVQLGPDIPQGPWQAEVTATSGLLERTVAATISFPDAGESQAVTPSGQPWIAFAAVAALLIAGALVLVLRSRRRTTHGGRRGPSPV